MTVRKRLWLLGWSLASVLALSCTEHDPEIDRVGGLLPDTDASLQCGAPAPASMKEPWFPCEIDDILQRKCRRCHTDPQENGAPFPLLTWDDTQAIRGGTKHVYERMYAAVDSDFMPFVALKLDPPVQGLHPQEKAALLAWLDGCARPVERGPACSFQIDGGVAGMGGMAGSAGMAGSGGGAGAAGMSSGGMAGAVTDAGAD